MKMKAKALKIIIGLGLIAACLMADGWLHDGLFVGEAQAIVGRPLTPVSVAGVARRTTRRVIRRTSVVVATLPVGCSTVVIEGVTLHQCGGTYYQAQGTQYVVVTVQ